MTPCTQERLFVVVMHTQSEELGLSMQASLEKKESKKSSL